MTCGHHLCTHSWVPVVLAARRCAAVSESEVGRQSQRDEGDYSAKEPTGLWLFAIREPQGTEKHEEAELSAAGARHHVWTVGKIKHWNSHTPACMTASIRATNLCTMVTCALNSVRRCCAALIRSSSLFCIWETKQWSLACGKENSF